MLMVFCALAARPAHAQTPFETPTPYATIYVPDQDMAGALATSNANMANAPSDLTRPDGATSILPTTNTTVLFAYAKWLISANAAEEMTDLFAPIVQSIGINVTITILLTAIYFLVYVAQLMVRWVVWFFKLIMNVIGTVGRAVFGFLGA